MSSEVFNNEGTELDGFVSDDGKHHVVWDLVEVSKDLEYETWYCTTHKKPYLDCQLGGTNGKNSKKTGLNN